MRLLFTLVYGTEAVTPIEVSMRTIRTNNIHTKSNKEGLQVSLDLVEDQQHDAAIRQFTYKALTEKYHDKRVRGRSCRVGDLLLRKNEASRQEPTWILSSKWEGHYRVIEPR